MLADQLERRRGASPAPRRGRRRPGAAHRRAAGRARAGHHHRRRLPLLRHAARARSSSPTPRATCSTPATWSPAPPPPSWRSCSSTPATACVEQTRRHATVAALLRVPHVVLAVNKMDLVDYDEAVFAAIADGVHRVRASASASRTSPRSRSRRCRRQRRGPLGADALVRRPDPAGAPGDGAGRARRPDGEPFRVPGADVIRPQTAEHPDYRGYAGQIASGVRPVGDEVIVLPSGAHARSPASTRSTGRSTEAHAPAVGHAPAGRRHRHLPRRPDRRRATSRRDGTRTSTAPSAGSRRSPAVAGQRCWSSTAPARSRRSSTPSRRLDIDTLAITSTRRRGSCNDIGRIRVRPAEPLALDRYADPAHRLLPAGRPRRRHHPGGRHGRDRRRAGISAGTRGRPMCR